jgi:hypothetical protein
MLYTKEPIDLDKLERQGNNLRRLKSIRIAPDVLPHLMMSGTVHVDSPIPEDAKGVMWALSDDKRTILLILRSQEFEVVPMGELPPEIDSSTIVFERVEYLIPQYEE